MSLAASSALPRLRKPAAASLSLGADEILGAAAGGTRAASFSRSGGEAPDEAVGACAASLPLEGGRVTDEAATGGVKAALFSLGDGEVSGETLTGGATAAL